MAKLEQFLADHLLLMGAVGIGVACLQVSGAGDGSLQLRSQAPVLGEVADILHMACPTLVPSLSLGDQG